MAPLFKCCALAALGFVCGPLHAALIVNPALPITQRINVNLISVADNDGTDSTAGAFGNAAVQAEVFSHVDTIFARVFGPEH